VLQRDGTKYDSRTYEKFLTNDASKIKSISHKRNCQYTSHRCLFCYSTGKYDYVYWINISCSLPVMYVM